MTKNTSFKTIENAIRAKQFMPIYLFQGEESYYTDLLTNLLIQSVLDEVEKDLNQTIVYGSETNVPSIINICRKYPMMAKRQLIVIKEAQALKNINDLIHYVKQPLSSTILVINYKYGKLEGRKKLVDEIAKVGIIFESKKIINSKIPDFIIDYLKGKQIEINFQIAKIITDHLGNDLSKIVKELDKLSIVIPIDQKRITADLIEKNIGISKDFNNFELQNAVAVRDILKVNRIAFYFEQNPRNNPLILTLSVLFGFFVNLMICQYEKDQSQKHLMQVLGFKWNFQIANYIQAIKHYKPTKTMNNISLIRQYDAKAKGVKNFSVNQGKLLVELLYKLMH
ncbi:MAG: DNA polymerase III subunit delta [Candidatus Azobacteroides pseudotrichonymphae]|jgi:DNA polymerase-3 subunit delta|nr:MAG: DNA polymerase III subunit delta [Candidatus Azobacteroides pseudotrichonymphae]